MKKITKDVVVVIFALVSIIYLLNPGAGVFELIPDNLPIVGNLDEVAATIILLECMAHFGLDFRRIFRRNGRSKSTDI